jgi:hypothetical protein
MVTRTLLSFDRTYRASFQKGISLGIPQFNMAEVIEGVVQKFVTRDRREGYRSG